MPRSYIWAVAAVVLFSALMPLTVSVAGLHLDTLRDGGTPDVAELLAGALRAHWPVHAGLALGLVALFAMVRRGAGDADDDAAWTRQAPATAVAIAAGLSLFVELMLIRWQVSIFPFLGFYKNFSLFAAFAGLGLGYALAERPAFGLIRLVLPLLLWQAFYQTVMDAGLGDTVMTSVLAAPVSESLHMGFESARTRWQLAATYANLGTLFLLTALTMLPIGHRCGVLMNRLPNLRAYGANLAGSLGGVLAMTALSYFWTPPAVWFGMAALGILLFIPRHSRAFGLNASCGVAIGVLLAWPVAPHVLSIHSPYQHIQREYTADGLTNIRSAGHFFQRVHDFSTEHVASSEDEDVRRRALFYELPYHVFENPKSVAVVGAGSGNDIAAALRMGAERVDAVEIDPVIQAIGRYAHPERPYDDERTNAIVNDARSHFRTTGAAYDLIVYGLLDSHSVIANNASVRLDSYVYTVEGFREARERLAPGGHIALSFYVLSDELGGKIAAMLEEAFDGRTPVVLRATYTDFFVYLIGESDVVLPPTLLERASMTDITDHAGALSEALDVSTDDWPFFYMPERRFPFSYLRVVAICVIATVALVALFVRGRPRMEHGGFFLLGAAFMLLEAKAITELALQFGNTWHVVSVVIAAIMVMAFLANALVAVARPKGLAIPVALLAVSLVVGYAIAWRGGMPSTMAGRIGAVAILTAPLLFSGLMFSTALSRGGAVAGIMAANLLGAMTGGFLENTAMRFGYAALYMMALLLYVAAFVVFRLTPNRRETADTRDDDLPEVTEFLEDGEPAP